MTDDNPTAKSAKPKKSDSGEKTEGLRALTSMNGALFEAYAQAGRSYLSRLTAINEEIASFTAERMQENTRASQSLMQCKEWQDAVRVQQEWLQSTSQSYLQETQRLFGIFGQTALSGLSPLVEKAGEAVSELRRVS